MSDDMPVGPWSVRPAGQADAPVWHRMRCTLWPDEDETHRALIEAYFHGARIADIAEVLIATSNTGAIAGFAELSVRTDIAGLEHVRVGYVEGLYVRPHLRQRGVAHSLLQASRAWARQQGCTAFASDREDRVIVDRTFARSGHAGR